MRTTTIYPAATPEIESAICAMLKKYPDATHAVMLTDGRAIPAFSERDAADAAALYDGVRGTYSVSTHEQKITVEPSPGALLPEILAAAAKDPSVTHAVVSRNGRTVYTAVGIVEANRVLGLVGGKVHSINRYEAKPPKSSRIVSGVRIARVYVYTPSGPTSSEVRVDLRDGTVLRVTDVFGLVACEQHARCLARSLTENVESVGLWPERWEACGRVSSVFSVG